MNECGEGGGGGDSQDSTTPKVPILRKQEVGTLEKELLYGQDDKFGYKKVESRFLRGKGVGNESW